MSTTARIGLLVLSATCALCLAASVTMADMAWNLESGVGHDGEAIGSVSGLVFGTVSGGSMYYADIDTGNYSVTSDNGKAYNTGEYYLSGDVAAYVSDLADWGKISLTSGSTGFFSIGYSSQFDFNLEAYDLSGALLASASGAANTKSHGGTSLSYLTVTHPGISYVVLHDHGGYWLVDNVSVGPVVPEPGALVGLGAGLVSLAMTLKRRQASAALRRRQADS